MPTQWYQGTVTEIIQMSPTTRQFKVRIMDEDGIFDFLPGQFITLDLPVSEKRLFRWRSYSIANHPDQSNQLELVVVKSDTGLGTKYLFDEIKVGEKLKFKGPDGGFILPPDLEKEIVMICTGTGVAPFRSMIRYISANKLPYKHIHLIFGTRYANGILYRNEFELLKKNSPTFFYDVALSREGLKDCHHGYVHDVYLEKYKEISPDRHFYICGWSHMIDETVANLIIKAGYDKSQIHYELYG